LKITPAHDPHDFEVAMRHNLPVDVFAIDKDNKFTSVAGEFAGKPVDKVLENIITMLQEIGNLEKIEDYEHSVPYCSRCGTRVQPMVSKQWFVNVSQAAKQSIEAVKSGETKIYPTRFEKVFFNWLENIQPWCISRQLWRGHRIPVWYCSQGHTNVLDEDYLLQLWQDGGAKSPVILSLIIFNLIADSRLKNPFNVEQLVELLFSPSLLKHQGSVLNAYFNVYSQKFAQDQKHQKELNEIKKIIDLFESGEVQKA